MNKVIRLPNKYYHYQNGYCIKRVSCRNSKKQRQDHKLLVLWNWKRIVTYIFVFLLLQSDRVHAQQTTVVHCYLWDFSQGGMYRLLEYCAKKTTNNRLGHNQRKTGNHMETTMGTD
eukprot:622004_1